MTQHSLVASFGLVAGLTAALSAQAPLTVRSVKMMMTALCP